MPTRAERITAAMLCVAASATALQSPSKFAQRRAATTPPRLVPEAAEGANNIIEFISDIADNVASTTSDIADNDLARVVRAKAYVMRRATRAPTSWNLAKTTIAAGVDDDSVAP